MNDFRSIVHEAAYRHCRGHIAYCTHKLRKTRSGRYYSDYIEHEHKDAILRRVGKKSWEITLPSGNTFRKQEDSYGFHLVKTTLLKPKGYAILLKKRTAHPSTTS